MNGLEGTQALRRMVRRWAQWLIALGFGFVVLGLLLPWECESGMSDGCMAALRADPWISWQGLLVDSLWLPGVFWVVWFAARRLEGDKPGRGLILPIALSFLGALVFGVTEGPGEPILLVAAGAAFFAAIAPIDHNESTHRLALAVRGFAIASLILNLFVWLRIADHVDTYAGHGPLVAMAGSVLMIAASWRDVVYEELVGSTVKGQ